MNQGRQSTIGGARRSPCFEGLLPWDHLVSPCSFARAYMGEILMHAAESEQGVRTAAHYAG